MLSEYQLKIADLYNIPIGNVRKLVCNFFDKEKYVLETKIKPKKIHCVLEFNQSQWLKHILKLTHKKE